MQSVSANRWTVFLVSLLSNLSPQKSFLKSTGTERPASIRMGRKAPEEAVGLPCRRLLSIGNSQSQVLQDSVKLRGGRQVHRLIEVVAQSGDTGSCTSLERSFLPDRPECIRT